MVLAKKRSMIDALKTLDAAVQSYQESQYVVKVPTELSKMFDDVEALKRQSRDSLIQRFEYCTDLLWKYAKEYLESVEQKTLDVNTPRGAIRGLCSARIITEQEAEQALDMIKHRNITSHIYYEEIAEIIAGKIPEYAVLMHAIIGAIERNLK